MLTKRRSNPSQKIKDPSLPRPGRQARQLNTRLNTLNIGIERLQRKLTVVEAKLADPELYEEYNNPDLHGLLRDQHSLKEELEPLEEEWLELQMQLESQ